MQRKEPLSSRRKAVGFTIACIGVVASALLTLTPGSTYFTTSSAWCLLCGETGSVDAILNVAMFVPIGLGLGIAGVRTSRALMLVAAFTLLIESLQFAIVPGRDASIGDVLTNTTGGGIGYIVGCHVVTLVIPAPHMAVRLMVTYAVLWVALQALVLFAFTPSFPGDVQYYGQLGRALGGQRPYSGRILEASLDGAPIPDTRFPDSRAARALLTNDGGAEVLARVIPLEVNRRVRSIVRIADDGQREHLQLAERGTDAVFGVHTHAQALRLRPLRFMVHDAFPAIPAGDTVTLRARYAPPMARVAASSARTASESVVRVSAGDGWRLVYPRQTYVTPSKLDRAMHVAWLAAIMLPAGYFAVFTARAAAVLLTTAVGLTALGMGAVPLIAGFGVAPFVDVAGTLLGFGVGAFVARAGTLRYRSFAVSVPG